MHRQPMVTRGLKMVKGSNYSVRKKITEAVTSEVYKNNSWHFSLLGWQHPSNTACPFVKTQKRYVMY